MIEIDPEKKSVYALGPDDIEDKAYTYEKLILDPELSIENPLKINKFQKYKNVAFPLNDYHKSFAISREIKHHLNLGKQPNILFLEDENIDLISKINFNHMYKALC